MRWFQSPRSQFVEPVLVVPLPSCVRTVKMTILPLPVDSPSERELFPVNVSADSPHFFPVDSSSPGKPRQPLAWWTCSSYGLLLELLFIMCMLIVMLMWPVSYQIFIGVTMSMIITCSSSTRMMTCLHALSSSVMNILILFILTMLVCI